jgi:hypothetical protein
MPPTITLERLLEGRDGGGEFGFGVLVSRLGLFDLVEQRDVVGLQD